MALQEVLQGLGQPEGLLPRERLRGQDTVFRRRFRLLLLLRLLSLYCLRPRNKCLHILPQSLMRPSWVLLPTRLAFLLPKTYSFSPARRKVSWVWPAPAVTADRLGLPAARVLPRCIWASPRKDWALLMPLHTGV